MIADELFHRWLTDPVGGDIQKHLWTLRRYGSCCHSIVELGTHDGTSASAFLAARPGRLDCYDIIRQPQVDELEEAARQLGIRFAFHEEDSTRCSIPACDLLFVDTLHTEENMRLELRRHAGKVGRYILLHDTEAFAFHDRVPGTGGHGIWTPIAEFLREHQEWSLTWHHPDCNGLTLLTRTGFLR